MVGSQWEVFDRSALYVKDPERAKLLLAALEKDVTSGRSTTGPSSTNDAPIVLWKEKTTRTRDSGAKRKKTRKKPAKK